MKNPLRWLLFGHGFERAGFYVVLDLIALYANEQLGWSVASASLLGGVLGGAAYIGPIIGGQVSDRVGRATALSLGALALLTCYVSLAAGLSLLLIGALLAVGNGLYKPSATALCGTMADQRNKQAAYYKFYIATNVGALAAPVIGELIRMRVGWTATWCIAAASVAVTAVISRLRVIQHAPEARRLGADEATVDRKLYASEKTLAWVYAAAAIFWVAFCQFNGSLTFFARDWVDRRVPWVGEIPPGIFPCLNSLFVVILGERVPNFFKRLGFSFKQQLSASMAVMAAGFCCVYVSVISSARGTASMLGLVAIYFAMTVSELLISPAVMTLVSHAAPEHKRARHMGYWFIANAVGHFTSGGFGAAAGLVGYDGVFMGLIVICLIGVALMRLAARGIREYA